MRRACGLLLCSLLLAGCGGGNAESRVKAAGPLQAQLILNPDPPHVGHDSGFAVALAENGAPVTGAKTHIALLYKTFSQTGPEADMRETSPGRYQADELSTGMNGQWEADVTVRRNNHPDASFVFLFHVAK